MQMTIDLRIGEPIVGAIAGNSLIRAAVAAFRSWRIEARNRRAFNAMGDRADIGIAHGDLQYTVAGRAAARRTSHAARASAANDFMSEYS
jgi:hypothetical protein